MEREMRREINGIRKKEQKEREESKKKCDGETREDEEIRVREGVIQISLLVAR